jgi:hypothetical protein
LNSAVEKSWAAPENFDVHSLLIIYQSLTKTRVAIAITRHLLQGSKALLLGIFRHASILHGPVGIPVLGKCQFGNVASGKTTD